MNAFCSSRATPPLRCVCTPRSVRSPVRGGIRFELDHPIELGSTITMRIELPSNCDDAGLDHCVFVTGNVIWCDLDEPGPSKMAMAITRYDRQGDKARMLRSLTSKRYLRAA